MALGLANSFLHSIGSYLIITEQRRQKPDTPQNLFLINLSFSNVLKNLVFLYLLFIVSMDGKVHSIRVKQMITAVGTNLNMMYFCSIVLITGDRLLAAILNLKYRIHCTFKRGKYVIIGQWLFGLFNCAISIKMKWFSSIEPFNCSITVGMDICYLIFVIFSYSFIFKTFFRSKKTSQDSGSKISAFKSFRQSRFYVSVLLISSYVIFVVFPDLLGFLLMAIFGEPRISLIVIWVLLRNTSDFLDWCIYVFAKDSTRKLFFEKICCCCKKKSSPQLNKASGTPPNASSG